jgi:multiple sugar transport system ATP-binding protein
MSAIELRDLVKRYDPDSPPAVDHLDLRIEDGEFMVLVGPSGCGKTTALRMIAGLEDITAGHVVIGDRVVNSMPSRDRDVAMVFQSYALYPHLTVRDNIGFGLVLRKTPKAEVKKRVNEVAGILGLEEMLGRKPRALSGGQRQRVAMGRAIVRQPQAFLMDEPLSNLDAKLRVQMRAEIARIQRDLGVTTIYVTHDQTEAMTLGDRVAVMKKGVLQQVAPPQELYDRPVNLFVAGFIGSPAMNMLTGRLERAPGGGLALTLGSQTLTVGEGLLTARPGIRQYLGQEVVVGIRPEDMEDADVDGGADAGRVLQSTANLVEAMGSDVMVHFSVDAPPVVTEDTKELARDTGDELSEARAARHSNVIARVSPRTAIVFGAPVRIRVETDRVHVFDPQTGLSIWGDDSTEGVA